jgi:HAMP domain-containing protein
MPQKFKTFLERNWFALLTIIGLAINGYFSVNLAQRDHSREIGELRQSFSNLNINGTLAMRDFPSRLQAITNELVALKEFTFKVDRKMNRLERNQDRISWVVDEIARKNGITPPKQIPEPATYE